MALCLHCQVALTCVPYGANLTDRQSPNEEDCLLRKIHPGPEVKTIQREGLYLAEIVATQFLLHHYL